ADNVLQEKALDKNFFVKTLSNKLYQRKRLYTFKYSRNKSMRVYIDDFNRMIFDVAAVGINVEDVDQAMILLTSLPPSYDHFCDTILYGRSEIIVKNKLVSESTADNPAARLFITSGRSQERESTSSSKSRSNDTGSTLTVFTGNYGDEWILNSSATFHMTPRKDIFISYTNRDVSVRLGDNRLIPM
ncbi:hypothetical protein HN51_046928, partial [Arachis hypogaea]